jgi:hypothetical protein
MIKNNIKQKGFLYKLYQIHQGKVIALLPGEPTNKKWVYSTKVGLTCHKRLAVRRRGWMLG